MSEVCHICGRDHSDPRDAEIAQLRAEVARLRPLQSPALFAEVERLRRMEQSHKEQGLVPFEWMRRAERAEAVAAQRVGADPAVRDLLLCEFGTTEPDLIAESLAISRERDKGVQEDKLSLICLCEWWAERDVRRRAEVERLRADLERTAQALRLASEAAK